MSNVIFCQKNRVIQKKSVRVAKNFYELNFYFGICIVHSRTCYRMFMSLIFFKNISRSYSTIGILVE